MGWRLVCHLAYIIIRTLHATYRYRVFYPERRAAAAAHHPAGAFAIATWHGNSMAGTLAHTYQNFCPIISHSRDGELVAYTCQRMGVRPVRGSSSRGGRSAREEALAAMTEGYSVAVTVDGPKGPRGQAKPGIVDFGRKGQAAILPMAAIADRYWQLRSWDRLRIPKPFARIAVVYHEPILVPPELEGEAFEGVRQRVESRLEELEQLAIEALAHWRQSGSQKQS